MKVSNSFLWQIFFAFIVVVVCNSSSYVSLVIAIFVAAIILINFKLGVKIYLYVLFSSSAVAISLISGKDNLVTHSLMLDSVFGVTLFALLNAFLFFLVLIIGLSHFSKIRLDKYIFLGVILPLIIPLYGYVTNPLHFAISDSAQLIGCLIGFFLCAFAELTVEEVLVILIPVIFATMIYHFILFCSVHFAPLYYGAIGNLYPVVLLCLGRLSKGEKLAFLFLSMINLIIFPGRSRLLSYAYIFVCSCIGRLREFKFIILIIVTILVFVLGVAYLLAHSSGVTSVFFMWKLTSFFGESQASVSSYIRVLEFENILALDLHSWVHALIGGGYGSCFHDHYVHYPVWALYAGTSYPLSQENAHCFVKPHLNVSVILLKAGLVFSIVFFISNAYLIFWKLRRLLARSLVSQSYRVLYIIPFWAVVEFNSQSFVIYGVFIYLLNQAFLSYRGRE